MEKNNYLYLRGAKHVIHTVFCVDDGGQKTYFDEQFKRPCAYSSGQQIKRSIIDLILERLNLEYPPVTFVKKVKTSEKGKKSIGEGNIIVTPEITSPSHLLGGFWKNHSTEEDDDILKRRAPLSIGAMSPLHPLLASVYKEDLVYNREQVPNTFVEFHDKDGGLMAEADVVTLLKELNSSADKKKSQYVKGNKRTTGLFAFDIGIDLRALFTVHEDEIDKKTYEALLSTGWVPTKYHYGNGITLPKKLREEYISVIADSIVDWRILTNQSRTFSPMETIALSIGNNASMVRQSIRAELTGDWSNLSAIPVVEKNEEVEIFSSPSLSAHMFNKFDKEKSIEIAKQYIKDALLSFDYENQL